MVNNVNRFSFNPKMSKKPSYWLQKKAQFLNWKKSEHSQIQSSKIRLKPLKSKFFKSKGPKSFNTKAKIFNSRFFKNKNKYK